MGRRTPGRRVPPRGPSGGRVPPRGLGDRRVPPPTTRQSGGLFGAMIGPVRAAAEDKLRGPVTRVPASAFKGKVFDSRTGLDKGPVKEPVRSKDPKPGSFESLLNKIEQQKKEAEAKTGSASLSFSNMAETIAKNKEEKTREAFLKDMEEKAKREQADPVGSGSEVGGFSATKFLELKNKVNPDFKDLTEGGTGTYSDAFRADLTKKINDEIKREEQIKAEKTGITKEGRSEFNYDAFKAKLEEIQRRKEEGKPVFKGIRGGPRPVRRTGGRPSRKPAPFRNATFTPRPTRPPVRYGFGGGPFGTGTFFGSRPSRPAPFFTPRSTRPPVRFGTRTPFGSRPTYARSRPTYARGSFFGVPFGMRRR